MEGGSRGCNLEVIIQTGTLVCVLKSFQGYNKFQTQTADFFMITQVWGNKLK